MAEGKNFLEKLQSAPETIKRRWIIGAAAVIMAIVIYVWLAYFNNLIIAGLSKSAVPYASSGQVPAESLPGAGAGSTSFLQTLKDATANLYNIFGGALRALGNILNSPREYLVKPPQ